MIFTPVNPPGAEATAERFHFSQGALVASGLLVCSGQIGTAADGSIPDDPAEDFHNAWRKVGEVLAVAGLGFEHLIDTTTFHVGLREHLATFMEVRDHYLSAPWPAWTAIGVAELAVPGARVEIRATAQGPAQD